VKDKHFIIALTALILPLSFGGGSAAGTKAAAEMNASHRASAKRQNYVTHGFTVAEMAALLAGSRIGSSDIGSTNELFVSSLDANRDARCGNAMSDTKLDKLNGDCIAINGGSSNARNSASGFPMYDSFKGSDTSQYSHSAGNSGLIGAGAGGGGGVGGGSVNPIVNDPVNPTVTISAPEPGTLMMLVSGLLMFGIFARRRMRSVAVSSN
jgi:hypothetical protein